MNKLLSIIIPVYKVERYIKKCLDSCLIYKKDEHDELTLDEDMMNQIEIIIVNDGTPDNSAVISREYVRRFPQSFRQIDKENGGHGSAWNVGLKEASGKYLRFLDSDDWLTNLDLLMIELGKTEADIVVTATNTVNEKTGAIKRDNVSTSIGLELPIASNEFGGNKSNFWCSTYKASLLKPLQPLFLEGVSYDDSILYIVPHLCAKSFIAFDFVVYNYLIGREGQSMSIETQIKKIPDMMANYHHLLSFVNNHAGGIIDDYVNEVLAHNRWSLFNVITAVPNYWQSATYMKQLLDLGGLDHIPTRKYRRYKILPYRLFHFLETYKRKRSVS